MLCAFLERQGLEEAVEPEELSGSDLAPCELVVLMFQFEKEAGLVNCDVVPVLESEVKTGMTVLG